MSCTCTAHASSNKEYSMVTSSFSREALGNGFLYTEHSQVTCICEGGYDEDVPSKITRIVVISRKGSG